MTLVVDASVALKWFVGEDGSDLAVGLLHRDEPLIAPELVLAEVCNAAWKSLRRGEIDRSQFEEVATDLVQVFQRLVPLARLVRRAAALARELDQPVYDCFYLALAEAEDAPLVTADRRLVAALGGSALAGRVQALR
jgi:predicted nucleic acid-binding protein